MDDTVKLDTNDLLAIQGLLKSNVEKEIAEEIAKFPEKSNDERFLLLCDASRQIQIGIARIGKAIELNG